MPTLTKQSQERYAIGRAQIVGDEDFLRYVDVDLASGETVLILDDFAITIDSVRITGYTFDSQIDAEEFETTDDLAAEGVAIIFTTDYKVFLDEGSVTGETFLDSLNWGEFEPLFLSFATHLADDFVEYSDDVTALGVARLRSTDGKIYFSDNALSGSYSQILDNEFARYTDSSVSIYGTTFSAVDYGRFYLGFEISNESTSSIQPNVLSIDSVFCYGFSLAIVEMIDESTAIGTSIIDADNSANTVDATRVLNSPLPQQFTVIGSAVLSVTETHNGDVESILGAFDFGTPRGYEIIGRQGTTFDNVLIIGIADLSFRNEPIIVNKAASAGYSSPYPDSGTYPSPDFYPGGGVYSNPSPGYLFTIIETFVPSPLSAEVSFGGTMTSAISINYGIAATIPGVLTTSANVSAGGSKYGGTGTPVGTYGTGRYV